MTAKETVDVMTDFVNSFSHDDKQFAMYMARQHRTLQQSFTRLIIAYLYEQAQETPDARNDASIEFSKKVIEMIENEKINFPLI